MNEAMQEGKRRYEELRDNSEFRAFIRDRENAELKALGKQLDDETRCALALLWRPGEEKA